MLSTAAVINGRSGAALGMTPPLPASPSNRRRELLAISAAGIAWAAIRRHAHATTEERENITRL